MHHRHFLLFITLFFSLSPPSSSDHGDTARWCDDTPHPGPCRYYLTHTLRADPPKHRSDFYRLVVQVSFDLALRAQSHLKSLRRKCHGEPEKTAWLDCWRLYANTVLQLNRTAHPSAGCTPMDSQTRLSAALTNLHTCHNGFSEIGAPLDLIQPVARYNISDLISNCLAINNGTTKMTATSAGKLPSWASVGNRKLLQLSVQANLVVSKDGSGNFGTIKAALDAAAAQRRNGNQRIVIYVKAGVYSENLNIVSTLDDLTIVGDGIGKTIITGGRSMANGYTTFSSATFSVFGDGFIASGITFRNTFGPGSQAVALLSGSDLSVFYRCSFEGYQDTLCVYSQRQFYRECDVYGTIDFIFGNAAAVLQNCNLYARNPRHGESDVITAQGRTDPNQNTGIVIQFSNILASPDMLAVRPGVRSYLGRPWQQYSRTVYLQSYISSIIDPAGWLPFNGGFGLSTLYYAEFRNTGPGSRMSRRVTWPGYHPIVRPSLVAQFSVGRFIAGGTWLPSTGVPFYSTL